MRKGSFFSIGNTLFANSNNQESNIGVIHNDNHIYKIQKVGVKGVYRDSMDSS